MSSFLPGSDADLVTWSTTFAVLIGSTPTLYGLTAAQATAYDELRVDFGVFYQRAMDPQTRTKPNISIKNTTAKSLRAMSRQLARLIEATPTVTDDQKFSLGLNVRKPPAPIPVPSERPEMDIVAVVGRRVTVHLHDATSSSRRGKPAGVAAAWIYTYVGAEYPTDPTDWQFQGVFTKTECKIEFSDSTPAGTQVWFCAAWVNPKQQTGPVSVPVMTNLQGGMATPLTGKMKMAA